MNRWIHKNNPNTDIYDQRPISVCPSCKSEQVGDTTYCHECGQRNMDICPNCGESVIIKNAKYCYHCGKKYKE